MIFEIGAVGQTRRVTVDSLTPVDSRGGRFRIQIVGDADGTGGLDVEVDARVTDVGVSLRLPDGRTVDAATTARAAGELLVQLPHVDVPVVIDPRRRARHSGPLGGDGEQHITAPMPGRVLRILVATGDLVAAGQSVLVIEAMKMENELKVARAGRVREVRVAEASSVEAGRLLVVVDPVSSIS